MVHLHPHDLHGELAENRSLPELLADRTSAATGSWRFITGYLALTLAWVAGNVLFHGPDPFPFILYTMLVSVLAILLSSIILLAGNRQAASDRAHAANSYLQITEIDLLQKEQMTLLQLQLQQCDQLDRIISALEAHGYE